MLGDVVSLLLVVKKFPTHVVRRVKVTVLISPEADPESADAGHSLRVSSCTPSYVDDGPCSSTFEYYHSNPQISLHRSVARARLCLVHDLLATHIFPGFSFDVRIFLSSAACNASTVAVYAWYMLRYSDTRPDLQGTWWSLKYAGRSASDGLLTVRTALTSTIGTSRPSRRSRASQSKK